MHEIYLEKSAEKDLRKLPVSVFQRVLVHLKALSIDPTRLLKNAHLLRYPAASPSWQRGKKSLLIRCDATPHPSPCQARGKLVAAYIQVRVVCQFLGLRISPACA